MFTASPFPQTIYTYTAVQLQAKTFGELNSIAREFDIVPSGDRRCRQSWIDAIVGVELPLLALIENSPGVETDSVQAITQTENSSSTIELFSSAAKRSIESLNLAEFRELTFFELLELCRDTAKDLSSKSLGQLQNLRLKTLCFLQTELGKLSFYGNKRHRASWIKEIRRELILLVQIQSMMRFPRGLGRLEESLWDRPIEDFDALLLQFFPETKDVLGVIEVQVQEPIVLAAKTFPGVEIDSVQEPIVLAAKTFPGVETDSVQEPIESSVSVLECPSCGAVHALYSTKDYLDRSEIRCLYCNYSRFKNYPGPIRLEAQESISLAAKTLPGVTFSDRFLARYSPPQPEIHYQADVDGQLSLLDFEVVTANEPPDPDDFACLDDFFEAMAVWDAENPEPLEVSLDSMVYWVPCPEEWYWPLVEDVKRCPCGAVAAIFCDGSSTVTHIVSDGIGARSPPGGDAF